MDCYNSHTNEFDACKSFHTFYGLYLDSGYMGMPSNLFGNWLSCIDGLKVQPVCEFCQNLEFDGLFEVSRFLTSGDAYDPVGIWRNPDLITQDHNCVADCSLLGEGFENPSGPFDEFDD